MPAPAPGVHPTKGDEAMKRKAPAKRIGLNRETLQALEAPLLPRVAGGDTNTNTVCSDCLRVCVSWFSGCC